MNDRDRDRGKRAHGVRAESALRVRGRGGYVVCSRDGLGLRVVVSRCSAEGVLGLEYRVRDELTRVFVLQSVEHTRPFWRVATNRPSRNLARCCETAAGDLSIVVARSFTERSPLEGRGSGALGSRRRASRRLLPPVRRTGCQVAATNRVICMHTQIIALTSSRRRSQERSIRGGCRSAKAHRRGDLDHNFAYGSSESCFCISAISAV